MSAESASFPSGADELDGILKDAVDQVCAAAAPRELAGQVIERAAAWSPMEGAAPAAVADRHKPVRRPTSRWAAVTAACLAFATTIGVVVYWISQRAPHDQAPLVDMSNRSKEGPLTEYLGDQDGSPLAFLGADPPLVRTIPGAFLGADPPLVR